MAMSVAKVEELRAMVRDLDRHEYMNKKWDFVFWVTAVFIVAGAANITELLFAGDWDFWTDWKDRQWWFTITPFATIIIPSALQYIQWAAWRFPTGFTYTATSVFLADWIGRWLWWSSDGWAGYPLTFVWPITIVPAAILVDWFLFKTRSFVLTSVLGSILWTLALWVANVPLLRPYLQPVNWHGYMLTLADVQGIEYLRTQTPEYLRIIEHGNLRTFLGESTWVALLFGATVAIAGYWVGQFIGRYLSVWPIRRYLKQW